jgi:hypothetical protein
MGLRVMLPANHGDVFMASSNPGGKQESGNTDEDEDGADGGGSQGPSSGGERPGQSGNRGGSGST